MPKRPPANPSQRKTDNGTHRGKPEFDRRDTSEEEDVVTPEVVEACRLEILSDDSTKGLTATELRDLAKSQTPEALATVLSVMRHGSQRNRLKAAQIIGEWAFAMEAGGRADKSREGIVAFLASLGTPAMAEDAARRIAQHAAGQPQPKTEQPIPLPLVGTDGTKH